MSNANTLAPLAELAFRALLATLASEQARSSHRYELANTLLVFPPPI